MKPPVEAPTSRAGEAAGVDGEVVERRGELAPGARDEGLGRGRHGQAGVAGGRVARLVDPPAVDLDDAGHHRPTRPFTRFEQAAVDQELVEAGTGGRRHARSLEQRRRAARGQASERGRADGAAGSAGAAAARWPKKVRRRK